MQIQYINLLLKIKLLYNNTRMYIEKFHDAHISPRGTVEFLFCFFCFVCRVDLRYYVLPCWTVNSHKQFQKPSRYSGYSCLCTYEAQTQMIALLSLSRSFRQSSVGTEARICMSICPSYCKALCTTNVYRLKREMIFDRNNSAQEAPIFFTFGKSLW
jgi:hypothetical protein